MGTQDIQDLLLGQVEAEGLHCDLQLVVVDVAVLVEVEQVECFGDFLALLFRQRGEGLRVHGGRGEARFAGLAFALEALAFQALGVFGTAGEGGRGEGGCAGAGGGAVQTVSWLVGGAGHGGLV